MILSNGINEQEDNFLERDQDEGPVYVGSAIYI